MARVYLDHNASAPLREEARSAMLSAMDLVGNPSSVHGEGRAAKAAVERARSQIAASFGADGADIIFVSGATEAAALACAGRGLMGSEIEHDAVRAWIEPSLAVDAAGQVSVQTPENTCLQAANSETGVVQELPQGLAVIDATQAFGKLPIAFNWLGCEMALISSHKIGGPKGIGALVIKRGTELASQIKGGGQEMGRRAGTENVAAIAGFGAAAEAAANDLAQGRWEKVTQLRDQLEARLADVAKDSICVGQGSARLPNTTCLITKGWKGETQVMAMDLAGFAISAGSACSSGKVKPSAVLRAMGYDEDSAKSAMRVSLGLETTQDEIERFATSWTAQYEKFRARAA